MAAYATLPEFKDQASSWEQAVPVPLQEPDKTSERDDYLDQILDAAAAEIDAAFGAAGYTIPLVPADLISDATLQGRFTAQLKHWNIRLAYGFLVECPEGSALADEMARIRAMLAKIKDGECDGVPGLSAAGQFVAAVNPGRQYDLGRRMADRAYLIAS